jgi:predicted transcriptional regulator
MYDYYYALDDTNVYFSYDYNEIMAMPNIKILYIYRNKTIYIKQDISVNEFEKIIDNCQQYNINFIFK